MNSTIDKVLAFLRKEFPDCIFTGAQGPISVHVSFATYHPDTRTTEGAVRPACWYSRYSLAMIEDERFDWRTYLQLEVSRELKRIAPWN